jgi:hypothetical protein
MMTRMIRLIVAVLLTLVVGVFAASSELATVVDTSSGDGDRDLQTNTIINAACNFVSRVLPGDIVCDCAITVGFIFVCAFQNQFCLGPDSTGYCSTPSLQGDIRLLRQTIAFEFCLNDATNGGVATQGVCFNIGGELNNTDANSFRLAQQPADSSKPITKMASKFSSLLKSVIPSTPPQPSKLLDCVGMSDDEARIQCNSCQLCNNNTGYVFDCTNINELFIQSTCTPLSILTNLRDPNQDISFFPKFDAFN